MPLPIGKSQAIKAAKWLYNNFGTQIKCATENTPFNEILIYAIACQETAYRWLLWIDKYDVATVIRRCVLDASGDAPDTSRSVYPKNGSILKKEDKALYDILIAEGNLMRAMPQPQYPKGYSPTTMLYKGYGIFQYDAQFIKTDREFFAEKQWHIFDQCLKRLLKELNTKYKAKGKIWETVKAYNGSGERATEYANNVFEFISIINAAKIF